jgi:hypothetical protein
MEKTKEPVLDREIREVLAQYGGEIAANDVFFRGIPGGFSGSRVWEVVPASSMGYFLKQWPSVGPDLTRLRLIHTTLRHLCSLNQRGELNFPAVPSPIHTRTGDSIATHSGRLYDLTPKLSGCAVPPEMVSPAQVSAAVQSTAKTHLALQTVAKSNPRDFVKSGTIGFSPGLRRRFQIAADLVSSVDSLEGQINSASLPNQIQAKCRQLLSAGQPGLERLCQFNDHKLAHLPIQPCLRDLWYEHVLFDNSQVTGIIDFGSLGEDCVVTDLARLLRSWFPGDSHDFAAALGAYSEIRPLSEAERESFHWFDRTSRVLSAFQWIEWLAIQRRDFDDWEAVSKRLDFVLARLPPDPASLAS